MLHINKNTHKEIITATAMMIAQTMLAEPKNELVQSIENELASAPLPGKLWPGHGGVYTGIMRDGQHYWRLILAVDPMSIFNGAWGPKESLIEGANSPADGFKNTQDMIKSGKKHPILDQLIKFNKTGQDGHNDFYLPAIRENNLVNIYSQEHVEKISHWSSTQNGAYNAWYQDFEYGCQGISFKDLKLAARAVRRELII